MSATSAKKKFKPKSTHKSSDRKRNHLYVISESTGNLARHMIDVAISQFPKAEFETYQRPFCDSAQKLSIVKKEIELDSGPIVFSALSGLRLKNSLAKWCDRRRIKHWDLIQPLIDFMAENSGQRFRRDVSRIHQCDSSYFRRIEAIEFTLQHDDNRRIESLDKADIILVGVSRVGKTPLSVYLGSLGYKTANVSLVKDQKLPGQLVENRDRAVGLTIDAENLAAIRKRRFELNRFDKALRNQSGSKPSSYHSIRRVLDEILYAEQQFRKLAIPVIDMTDRTVEECAVKIINRLDSTAF